MAAIDVLNRSQRFIAYKGRPFSVKNCRPIVYEDPSGMRRVRILVDAVLAGLFVAVMATALLHPPPELERGRHELFAAGRLVGPGDASA